ncbi:MAG: hypothetical protein AABY91_03610, partial [Gemmatimonadota bacterium]
MTFDTIIRGGTVVTPTGTILADVGIVGETIAAIDSGLAASATTAIIDATEHYVIPGVLDVHVHL